MDFVYPSIVFIISFTTCLFPRVLTSIKQIKKLYPYILAVSSGFMLAVLLLEFIPHLLENNHNICNEHQINKLKCAEKHGNDFCKEHNLNKSKCIDKHTNEEKKGCHSHTFNNGFFAAGLTFILLIAIDTLILHHSHCDTKEIADHSKHEHDSFGACNTDALKYSTSMVQALILVLALSIHSFFEGLIFSPKGSKSIELSILVHKVLESFTLGVTIATSKFGLARSILLCLFYSVLTPAGMLVGNTEFVSGTVQNIFNGTALGSTLFIVCIEMIPPILHDNSSKRENVRKILCLAGGFMFTSGIYKFMSGTHAH